MNLTQFIDGAKNIINGVISGVNNVVNSYYTTPYSSYYSSQPTTNYSNYGTPQNTLQSAYQNAANAITTVTNNYNGELGSTISNTINSLYSNISSQLNNVINSVSSISGSINSQINNWISGAYNLINQSTGGIAGALFNVLSNIDRQSGAASANIFATITGALNGFAPIVQSIVKAAVPDVYPFLQNSFNYIGELTNKFQNYYNEYSSALKQLANEHNVSITAFVRDIVGQNQRTIDAYNEIIKSYIDAKIKPLENQNKDILSQIGDFLTGILDLLEELPENTIELVSKQLDNLGQHIDSTIGKTVNSWIDYLQSQVNKIKSVVNDIKTGEITSYSELMTRIENLSGNMGIISLIITAASIIPTIISLVKAPTDVFAARIQQLAIADTDFAQLSSAEILALARLGTITGNSAKKYLENLGYSHEHSLMLLQLAWNLLPPDTIKDLYLRGIISEVEHDKKLDMLGYSSIDITNMKKLYYDIPPIQDLIRFTVREVFDPTQVERLGLSQAFPENVVPFAEKQGLSRDWVLKYWQAHWELPSPTMGFEMFQRGIISRDDLFNLLKALDYAPIWHDKLMQLSYNPLTRVDVRRMFGLGVLDYDEMVRAYQDIGYSPQNAQRLAEFTKRYETKTDENPQNKYKDLTRGIIEKAYKRNVITYDNAIQRLMAIGYDLDESKLLLSLVDYGEELDNYPDRSAEYRDKLINQVRNSYSKRLMDYAEAKFMLQSNGYTDIEADAELSYLDLQYEIKLKDVITDYVKKAYIENTIDKASVIAFLTQHGFNSAEIDRLLFELDILRELKGEKPSKVELGKFLQSGIISIGEYYEEMSGLGYNDRYINWYLAGLGMTGEN